MSLPKASFPIDFARTTGAACFVLGALLSTLAIAHRGEPDTRSFPGGTLTELGRTSLSFEPNLGQTGPSVGFLSRAGEYTVLIAPAETQFVFRGSREADRSASHAGIQVLRMKIVGADPTATAVGREQLMGKANYFRGRDPEKWVSGVPTFASVQCEGIYPGVDLVYRGRGEQLEYDFVLSPGVDPRSIRLAFAGCSRLELDANGNLLLHTAVGALAHRAPVIYQERAGRRSGVAGRFVLRAGDEVGFEVAGHDPSLPLVIDPTVVFSRFVGGTGDDGATSVTVDADGNVYVAGYTGSVDFPVTNGGWLNGPGDAFVIKLDPTGTNLLYSTYLGGSGGDYAHSIVLDSLGDALVTGSTQSSDFPTSSGAPQPMFGGGSTDVFLAALDELGALRYATYLGGSGSDSARDGAIGPGNDVYVTGYTGSSDLQTTPGAYDSTLDGSSDAFLAVLSPGPAWPEDEIGLAYLSYLGGGVNDQGWGVDVDSDGVAYLTGYTVNEPNNPPIFPTTANAYRSQIRLRNNQYLNSIFISKLDPAGNGTADLLYSSFLMRDPGLQSGRAIAVDDFGRAYVAGPCHRKLPTTDGAYDSTYNGGTQFSLQDTFVVVLNTTIPGVPGLEYGTYLGGYGGETPAAVAVRGATAGALGEITVAGFAGNDEPDPHDNIVLPFPLTSDAFQTTPAGYGDGYLSRLQLAGNGEADLLFSTLIGGGAAEVVRGLSVDSTGQVHIVGETDSADLVPTPTNQLVAGQDAFVIGIEFGSSGSPPAAPSNLTASAISSSEIDLGWIDEAYDEDGFEVERSPDASNWTHIDSLGPNASAYFDAGLAPATEYFYRVWAHNAAGPSAYSNVASATTAPGGGGGDAAATGEVAVAGTVTGSFLDTQANDGGSESIRERESNGNPANRTSYLEHKWTFDVPPGSTVILHLRAYRSVPTDGDDFLFSYSTDDANYIDLITVTETDPNSPYQTAGLPSALSGTVYLRVQDTDRTPGHRAKDTLYVDHVFIRSE